MPFLENWTLLWALDMPTEKAKPATTYRALQRCTAGALDVIMRGIIRPFSPLEGMRHFVAPDLPTLL